MFPAAANGLLVVAQTASPKHTDWWQEPGFVVAAVLAVAGILATMVTYARSRNQRRPFYLCKVLATIATRSDPRFEDVEIFHKQEAVDRVTTCRVYVWNNGREAIKESDIAGGGVLHLELADKSARILRVRVLASTRVACKAEARQHQLLPYVATLKFEFLDRKDGFLLEVLHDCENPHLSMEGVVLGAPKGFKRVGWHEQASSVVSGTVQAVFGSPVRVGWLAMGVGAVGLLLAALPLEIFPNQSDGLGRRLPYLAAISSYFIGGAFVAYVGRRRYPRVLDRLEAETAIEGSDVSAVSAQRRPIAPIGTQQDPT